MKRIIYLIFSFTLFYSQLSFSQTDSTSLKYLGAAIQIYPAGVIATVHKEVFYDYSTSLYFRLGGNFANRHDYSPYNDNEKGSGFGGSVGYRKHKTLKKGSLLIGANLDTWNMWIDWKNDIGETNQTQGTTYTLVLQPWLEGGYFTDFNNAHSQIGVTAGLGREINIVTAGKKVAAGWIGSLSIYLQFLIK